MAATATRERFFAVVSQHTDMNALYSALSATTNDPEWIEFYSAKYVSQGDALYLRTQLALGYTSAQMQALFDEAIQVPS